MNRYFDAAIVFTAVGSLGLATFSVAEDRTYSSYQDTVDDIPSQTIDDGANNVFQPLNLPSYPLEDSENEKMVAINLNLAADYQKNLLEQYQSVSPVAINLIKEFEGFRDRAYLDTDGTPVIGYGLSRIAGKPVRLGDSISPDRADEVLEAYLQELQDKIRSVVKVPLSDPQLSALTSLAFNVGFESFARSTLVRKLNAGDYAGAANEFPRWDKANVRGMLVQLPGLTRRRHAEKQLFLQ
ncbi:MAG: hypothetical protein Tsb0014_42270 [Pleurocapsa sp.]